MDSRRMSEKQFQTKYGPIVYWVSEKPSPDALWLVFLPGLTADHRLFEKQVEYFQDRANILVWDPPSHGESRPFQLTWSLDDLATWIHEIVLHEGGKKPILVGQSMGGYVSQAYIRRFPDDVLGFVSVDSCPLGFEYYQSWELFFLRHTKLMYLSIPWKTLKRVGANGCSTTDYGRNVMAEMMNDYEKREYCELAAHGYRVLADAVSPNCDYSLSCPTLLICGTKDMAGSAKRYNQKWSETMGLPIHWIEGAGHNSNTDKPIVVNALIEEFAASLA